MAFTGAFDKFKQQRQQCGKQGDRNAGHGHHVGCGCGGTHWMQIRGWCSGSTCEVVKRRGRREIEERERGEREREREREKEKEKEEEEKE